MKMGIAGLGKMGANMVRRLRRGGIEVVAFNRSAAVTDALVTEAGIAASYSLAQLVAALPVPRVVWLMLPAAPAGNRVTMGLDPGLRTGVKVAVVDRTG